MTWKLRTKLLPLPSFTLLLPPRNHQPSIVGIADKFGGKLFFLLFAGAISLLPWRALSLFLPGPAFFRLKASAGGEDMGKRQ